MRCCAVVLRLHLRTPPVACVGAGVFAHFKPPSSHAPAHPSAHHPPARPFAPGPPCRRVGLCHQDARGLHHERPAVRQVGDARRCGRNGEDHPPRSPTPSSHLPACLLLLLCTLLLRTIPCVTVAINSQLSLTHSHSPPLHSMPCSCPPSASEHAAIASWRCRRAPLPRDAHQPDSPTKAPHQPHQPTDPPTGRCRVGALLLL